MPDVVCRADRESGVARGGLHENLLERRRTENFSVGDAVECHSTRQADSFQAGSLSQFAQHAEIAFFEPQLKRRSEILVALLEGLIGRARGSEAAREFVGKQSL